MDDLRYQVDLLSAKNEKLLENERIYKLISNASNHAFICYQPESGHISTFGRWDLYFDFTLNEYADFYRVLDSIDDSDHEAIRSLFFLEKMGKESDSYVCKMKNGTYVEVNSELHRDDEGIVTDKVFCFKDVTERQKSKDELIYMAYYDYMTNLYNRNNFIVRFSQLLEKAKTEHQICSLLLIDIDDFHKVSDGLGMLAGDEVIQNFGIFLHDLTNEFVIGAHFDSDVFAIGIFAPIGSRSVDSIYQQIQDRLSKPFYLTDGAQVQISVSIGVSEYPESSDNALHLINCAEIVLLKAKQAGKNAIRFFDTQVLNEFMSSIKIENKLKEAVHSMDFFIYYQPQFFADNKRLRGVEALIRWRDKQGTLIPPSLFIPIAEKNGSIVNIGDWVLEESIKTHMSWKKKFDVEVVLSVNISAIQYKRSDFVSKVISFVSKYGMDPKELELEITESILIDDFSLVVEKMNELRDFGIRVSIDDFGTGFSSLQYLKGLPVDTIKIDKSFIDTLTSDCASQVIAESIILMAKKLGFETVAEGVETEEQYSYLKQVSCDLIQGYLLGKPMDESAIEEILLRMI